MNASAGATRTNARRATAAHRLARWRCATRGLRSVWVLLASGAPRQVAQLLSECPGSGLSIAMRPATKPGVIVEEELPVADDAVPHEQKRHRRLEWSEARFVERSSRVALVIGPEEDSVFDVRRNGKLLE